MSYSIAIALEHNVSFINLNDRHMYLSTHTHTNLISPTFSLKLVQSMTCSIAIALEHIAIRYAKQRNKILKSSHRLTSTLRCANEYCHLPAVLYRVKRLAF